MKTYNLIIVMTSGYVFQIKLKAHTWKEAKDKEWQAVLRLKDVDFWLKVEQFILKEITDGVETPHFSNDYEDFMEELLTIKK